MARLRPPPPSRDLGSILCDRALPTLARVPLRFSPQKIWNNYMPIFPPKRFVPPMVLPKWFLKSQLQWKPVASRLPCPWPRSLYHKFFRIIRPCQPSDVLIRPLRKPGNQVARRTFGCFEVNRRLSLRFFIFQFFLPNGRKVSAYYE